MGRDYLKYVMLRVESEFNKSSVVGFIHGSDSHLVIKAVESAIAKGYLEKGGQANGAIIVSGIKEAGWKYLKNIKAQT